MNEKQKREIQDIIQRLNGGEHLPRRMGTITRNAEKREDGEEEVTYNLSFSSEEPYERWFGMEILGHKADEVEMDWVKGGTAPLLLQHDPDRQIGVIRRAEISGSRGKAVVRFGSGELAKEIQQDVDDKVRGNVSVGYEVLDMELVKSVKDGPDEYRVTKWRPREISIVSVPADTTVGVGRGKQNELKPKTKIVVKTMNEEEKEALRKQFEAERKDDLSKERARISEITRLGKSHRLDDEAQRAIADGASINDFQGLVLKKLEGGHKPIADAPLSKGEQRDLGKFSLMKAIRGRIDGRLDGIELEMHQEGVKEATACGRSVGGIAVPTLILRHGWGQRDLTVTEASHTGDQIVPSTLQTGSFIESLRSQMVLRGLGVRFMEGLTGLVPIPKMVTGSSVEMEGENDAAASTTPVLGQVNMAPHRISAKLPYSIQLLKQTDMSVEALLRDDLMRAIAEKLERQVLTGSGVGDNIKGVANFDLINTVAVGAAGGVPTWADFVAMETAVADANVRGTSQAYLINAVTRGLCKTTLKASGVSGYIMEDGEINGYKAEMTNLLPKNGTKGAHTAADLSTALFGEWSDLIVGQWGGLDILVDPFTRGDEAMVNMIPNLFADAVARHDEAFSVMSDIDVDGTDSIT